MLIWYVANPSGKYLANIYNDVEVIGKIESDFPIGDVTAISRYRQDHPDLESITTSLGEDARTFFFNLFLKLTQKSPG